MCEWTRPARFTRQSVVVLALVLVGLLHRNALRARDAWSFRLASGLCDAARLEFLSAAPVFVYPHSDISQNAIVDSHAPLEFGNFFSRPFDLEEHKSPFGFVQDLVSELAFTHGFRLVYYAALIGYELLKIIGEALHFIVVRHRISDKNDLILSVSIQNHPLHKSLPIADCRFPIADWQLPDSQLALWQRTLNFRDVPIVNLQSSIFNSIILRHS